MNLKKVIATSSALLVLASLSTPIYANKNNSDELIKDLKSEYSQTSIVGDNDNLIQLSGDNEEEIEEIVKLIMQKYKEDGMEESEGSTEQGAKLAASVPYCSSQCEEGFRYDSPDPTTVGYAKNLAQVQGYHWNNGYVNWTKVGGSSITNWWGSGTAKSIGQELTLSVSQLSIAEYTPPSSFKLVTGSKDVAKFTPTETKGQNAKATTFAGGSAKSGVFLGAMTLKSQGHIIDPNGYDVYLTATAVID